MKITVISKMIFPNVFKMFSPSICYEKCDYIINYYLFLQRKMVSKKKLHFSKVASPHSTVWFDAHPYYLFSLILCCFFSLCI